MIKTVIFDMYETLITLYNSPNYFGPHMAEDAGIPVEKFKEIWSPMEDDRSIGKISLEEIITLILEKNNCYSKELLEKLVEKRVWAKAECFKHLNPEIIPMLESLKRKNVKIGLISNCFSEEARLIRESILYSFFDAVMLSYEQGVKKPNEEIYRRCMKELHVTPEECLYIGDGGSSELEAADKLGMKALQAVWYLKEGTNQPVGRKAEFEQVERPLDILKIVGEENGAK